MDRLISQTRLDNLISFAVLLPLVYTWLNLVPGSLQPHEVEHVDLLHSQLRQPPSPLTTLSDEVWREYDGSSGAGHAAVFTPYHITPGGGEKYLLSAVEAMQSMGYFVTIYVRPFNRCSSVADLMQTASFLRVTLDQSKVSLQIWTDDVPRVHVFFVLGNEKHPQVAPIGVVNMFMCQFPFDLDRYIEQDMSENLGGFNFVLLNSFFSFSWYNRLLSPWINQRVSHAALLPDIVVLHPPVSLMSVSSAASERPHILMLGRFFKGRQSKGHKAAIEIFDQIRDSIPAGTMLYMIGQLVRDHEAYFEELHSLVAAKHLTDRVQIVNAAPHEVVNGYMMSSLVQWHLTGLDIDSSADPASLEHFGISIVEGMSAGIIPVACLGGPEDIITTGVDGYISHNLQEVRDHTLNIFALSSEAQKDISNAARARAVQFQASEFRQRFINTVENGAAIHAYRLMISRTLLHARSAGAAAPALRAGRYAALFVEPRNHYALEFASTTTSTVLAAAKESWILHIVHSEDNMQLVNQMHLHEHSWTHLWKAKTPQFPRLMKSSAFWRVFSGKQHLMVLSCQSLLLKPVPPHMLSYSYTGPACCVDGGDICSYLAASSTILAEPLALQRACLLPGRMTSSDWKQASSCSTAKHMLPGSTCSVDQGNSLVASTSLNSFCGKQQQVHTLFNNIAKALRGGV
eukprot:363760-Chlamydomonas_euryale.AAC.7